MRSYTKTRVQQAKDDTPIYGDWRDTLPGLQEFAEFVNEIDLHIERLTDRHAKLGNAEILRIQMAHFEAFLNKANRLGIASIFVIHGVGKGVLRDAIAERLRRHPEVREFKNEYHPKYGWGATEILFID
ncbi:MAG: Smr/MutS family protein [Saprospirales bacterium]|nr:Smr/MutS family protein [Saprospirales bacterium]